MHVAAARARNVLSAGGDVPRAVAFSSLWDAQPTPAPMNFPTHLCSAPAGLIVFTQNTCRLSRFVVFAQGTSTSPSYNAALLSFCTPCPKGATARLQLLCFVAVLPALQTRRVLPRPVGRSSRPRCVARGGEWAGRRRGQHKHLSQLREGSGCDGRPCPSLLLPRRGTCITPRGALTAPASSASTPSPPLVSTC
jgi:hypothetical protein